MQQRARRSLPLVGCLALALAAAVSLTVVSRVGSTETTAMAIDGDTIQLDGKVIELYGIDAPELGQHCLDQGSWRECGLSAAYELNKLLHLSRRGIRCVPNEDLQSAERVCFAGEVNVAEALLTAGYVAASPEANPDYQELEAKARAADLGLWQSEFVPPADWRQGLRLPGEPELSGDACPIKAIASGGTEGRYFVPTDSGYDTLAFDAAKGDRGYCSDESARADGWRHSGESAAP